MSKSRNIFLLFLLFLLLLGCEKKVKRVDDERFAFGTFFKISIFSNDEKIAKQSREDACTEIERIDSKYNSKVKGSVTDNLNTLKKETFDIEVVLLLIDVKKAYKLSECK